LCKPRHRKAPTGKKWLYPVCAATVLALDQITKIAILSRLNLFESIPLIPSFFHLTLIFNKGVSFGILQNQSRWFVPLACLVVAVIAGIVFFEEGIGLCERILLGIITGGALGNLADRIVHGAVVDFIDFVGVWPYIFNVADMAVVCGSLLLGLRILSEGRIKEGKQGKH